MTPLIRDPNHTSLDHHGTTLTAPEVAFPLATAIDPAPSNHVEAARALHAIGFRPHPLRPGAKAPLHRAWEKESAWSVEAVVARFIAAPPECGIGIRTDDLCVIDLDGDAGRTTLARLETRLGPLPRTVRAITGRGGAHVYMRATGLRNSTGGLGEGIDVRSGLGGHVVAPPSVIAGRPYRWAEGLSPWDVAVADLPSLWHDAIDRLAARARKAAVPPQANAEMPPRFTIISVPSERAHEAKRRAAYMASLTERSVQGKNGNKVMMRAAYHAKRFSRDEDEALKEMRAWNVRCADPVWSEADLVRAVRNSIARHGAAFDDPDAPSTRAASGT